MREILFKAKRVDDGEWVEGSLINLDIESGYCYIVPAFKSASTLPINFLITGRMELVSPETLCQFTGLCDKSGKKIWENDIIKYHFGEIYAPIKYGCYQNCFDSQKTEHIGFYVDWTGDKCLRKDLGYWINMVDAMPVGNVFDNPELTGGIKKSKSVLVIDTPEDCYSCCLRREPIRNCPHCAAKLKGIKDSSVKPDWCPLKPLPEKMKLTGVYNREYFQSNGKMPSYKIGWNDCIDEITGGEIDGEINTEIR